MALSGGGGDCPVPTYFLRINNEAPPFFFSDPKLKPQMQHVHFNISKKAFQYVNIYFLHVELRSLQHICLPSIYTYLFVGIPKG